MADALIGHTGFVGTTLLRQRPFDATFRSTDIGTIAGGRFDLVVCAGAPAQKWLANKDPQGDLARLRTLFDALGTFEARRFVLVSTVDVFEKAVGVDEDSVADATGPYGKHRLELEQRVRARFPDALVVRLPGLVGPGLRKNALYDLHHGNQLDAVDSRGRFQFYPMVNLWDDVATALDAGLRTLHLTAEPVSIGEVAREAFHRPFLNEKPGAPASYDLRSKHDALFGGRGGHQYSRRESLLAIRAYAQSEPKVAKGAGA